MLSNFSLPELLVVGALALIVIGPKDLPKMMRSVGKFMGQARGMAKQFQDSMNDAARELDMEEFRQARALMKKKPDTKALTDPFNKVMNFDDEAEGTVTKPAKTEEKQRALSKDEQQKLAEESGFGGGKPAETSEAEPAPAPETSPADVKTG